MKRILKVFLLLFGVMIHSQNTLSVKDGAYGYNTDFKLDIHLATDTAIKALQFDLKYDGDNFDYKSTFDLTKSRLGGEDSDHVITVKEVKSGNLRILIYSPSNKVIPNGDGELLKIDFSNTKKYAIYPFELVSVVASKEDLKIQLNSLEKKYDGKEIPRPEHWGGYIVKPISVEFWQGRPNRMHDRIRYSLTKDFSWKLERMAP